MFTHSQDVDPKHDEEYKRENEMAKTKTVTIDAWIDYVSDVTWKVDMLKGNRTVRCKITFEQQIPERSVTITETEFIAALDKFGVSVVRNDYIDELFSDKRERGE